MTDSAVSAIPLFPLNTLVFPKGRISLQIFEARYVDMVRKCLRDDSGFGVILIETGKEVAHTGMRLNIHSVGTYCKIVDWNQLQNGLLGITVEGVVTFDVVDCWQEKDQLCIGEVSFREGDSVEADPVDVGDSFGDYVQLLRTLALHPAVESLGLDVRYDNLREVSWRLCDLLPVTYRQKQKLLEIEDPLVRLEQVELYISSVNN